MPEISEADVQRALAHISEPEPVSYNQRDVILYAIGVGSRDLRYIYELHEDFQVLPSYLCVLAMKGTSNTIVPFKIEIPSIEIDLANTLHGEELLEVYQPLPPEANNWTVRKRVLGIADKGKGTVFRVEVKFFNEKQVPVGRVVSSIFVIGTRTKGGPKGDHPADPEKPSNKPLYETEAKTNPNQAEIYRLSGDYNPLHVDPIAAQISNFDKPILHGLCSFGFGIRALLTEVAGDDIRRFRGVRARFVKSVYPGETLVTKIWKSASSPSTYLFEVTAKERNVVVLANASATIVDSPDAPTPSQPLKCDSVFEQMIVVLRNYPDVIKKINAVYVFNLSNDSGAVVTFVADLKNAPGKIYKVSADAPAPNRPDCTFTAKDEDYFDVATGKNPAQAAFLQGKLKISGNIISAQKLGAFLHTQAKL
jgi:3-hydroxyacyl-CoA dehydrogenase/3a,7a,12a-trihydroxy-5b-cholest-24-enoyl-CoA hydratase